ncbi:MAG: hypothetical protein H6739_33965 [Alphaproteobacteria bacterium]|nr:hypothetical protein [Alphaproteobacteria bacterium]
MTAPDVLVLLRPRPRAPAPPEDTPIGRAALQLASEGIGVLIGTAQAPFRAAPGGWARAELDHVVAVHDRFPSWTWPDEYARAREGIAHLPLANPPTLQDLCRDKLACQRSLEAAGIPQPPVEGDPRRFAERLAEWGAGYLKPRYGALGRGVSRVTPGDPLPAEGPGATRGQLEPLILQRAVPPPPGVAGLALRVLTQRTPSGGWVTASHVARRSFADPVANVERGAEALPAEDLLPRATLDATDALCVRVGAALAALPEAEPLVELGVDVVIDPELRPHLIEVNSRPGGRLKALAGQDAARFAAAHVEACARPLRALAAWPWA